MFWPFFWWRQTFREIKKQVKEKKKTEKVKDCQAKQKEEKNVEEDLLSKEVKEGLISFENYLESSSRYGAYVETKEASKTPKLERKDAQTFEEQVAETQIDTPSVSGKQLEETLKNFEMEEGQEKQQEKHETAVVEAIPATPISQQLTLVLGEMTPVQERLEACLLWIYFELEISKLLITYYLLSYLLISLAGRRWLNLQRKMIELMLGRARNLRQKAKLPKLAKVAKKVKERTKERAKERAKVRPITRRSLPKEKEKEKEKERRTTKEQRKAKHPRRLSLRFRLVCISDFTYCCNAVYVRSMLAWQRKRWWKRFMQFDPYMQKTWCVQWSYSMLN